MPTRLPGSPTEILVQLIRVAELQHETFACAQCSSTPTVEEPRLGQCSGTTPGS